MRLFRRSLAVLGLLSLLILPAPALAQGLHDEVCRDNPDATLCQSDNPETHENNSIYGPNGIITKVVRLLGVVIGIAAVIMIIIGGLRYVMASGDPNSINGAKNTILYAIIGLIVAAMAQALVVFVISKL